MEIGRGGEGWRDRRERALDRELFRVRGREGGGYCEHTLWPTNTHHSTTNGAALYLNVVLVVHNIVPHLHFFCS
jgi:hypothetical protein